MLILVALGGPLAAQPAIAPAAVVRGLPEIEALPDTIRSLRGEMLNESAVAALQRFRDLRELELLSPVPQPRLLEQLARIRTIELLCIRRAKDLGSLAPLRELPNLRRLLVKTGGLRDADVSSLPGFPALEEIDVNGNWDLTSVALQSMARVPGLRRLTFNGGLLWPLGPGGEVRDVEAAKDNLAALAANPSLCHLGLLCSRERPYGSPPPRLERGLRVPILIPDPAPKELLTRLGNIESLTLEGEDTDRAEIILVGRLVGLERLVVDSTALEPRDLAVATQHARELVLRDCGSIHGELPACVRELDSLAVEWCRNLDDVAIASLAGGSLRRLALRFCPNLTPACLDTIVELPLEELQLEGLPWLTDRHLERIAAMASLRRLDLSTTRERTQVGVPKDRAGILHVGGKAAFSARGVASLAAGESLTRLGLAGHDWLELAHLRPLAGLPLQGIDLRETGAFVADRSSAIRVMQGLWPGVEIEQGVRIPERRLLVIPGYGPRWR